MVNLTEPPTSNVHSSVISLRGLRICLFLAELNNMEMWSTDIGYALLESYTDLKVHGVVKD